MITKAKCFVKRLFKPSFSFIVTRKKKRKKKDFLFKIAEKKFEDFVEVRLQLVNLFMSLNCWFSFLALDIVQVQEGCHLNGPLVCYKLSYTLV